MNQLNETLMRLRIQISAEKNKEKPNMENLKRLREEEKKCLENLQM